ncbi:expressed protein [Chlorella variabilis]|uniref:Expressed protein n=1 Tax=Chlorella variabilis TaxID=554065 RepID=E1ZGE2_CHLVA|nr:expressed protein [Chlorella variabilis]EFN54920.1 expressed protein [Chlorella variabilis]|eukprot:XP_005847022.1 expressed protein [Chlorella variabilis]
MTDTLSSQPPPLAATPRETVPFSCEVGSKQVLVPQSPGSKATPAAAFQNQLFSPGLQRQGSWTIEAQRSGRMEAAVHSSASAGCGASPSTGWTDTPASAPYLESHKVDDLWGRLESLEQALKDMESKAVQHLDISLQEKVLATAAKIVQKRFLSDKELDKKLQMQILQTAIKVVKRHAAAAPSEEVITRRLEFEQGREAGAAGVVTGVQQYIAHIEQNVLELLEVRLATGVVRLEQRLDVVEEAQQRAVVAVPSQDASHQMLDRVAAVEAALVEQGRAVADLLAALRTRGAMELPQQEATAVGEAQAATAHQLADPAAAVAAEPTPREVMPDAGRDTATAEPSTHRQEPPRPAPAAQQLHQRKSVVVKRSLLADPCRSAASSPKPALSRLNTMHAAGTAQRIAMATAREQLAKQAMLAREEEEVKTPLWVSMMYVFGWTLLLVVGLAALTMGALAVMVKNGRLSESDLEFVWR